MRVAGFAAGLLALGLLVGCGPAGEKIMEKAEKGIQKGLDAAFKAADQNNDGKITKAEFAGAEKKREKDVEEVFSKLDDDGNGVLTRDEFRKVFGKMRKGLEEKKKAVAEPKEK